VVEQKIGGILASVGGDLRFRRLATAGIVRPRSAAAAPCWGAARSRRLIVPAEENDKHNHQGYDPHHAKADAHKQRRRWPALLLGGRVVIIVAPALALLPGGQGGAFAIARLPGGDALARPTALGDFFHVVFIDRRLFDHEAVLALRAVDLFADEAGVLDGHHRFTTGALLSKPGACSHVTLSVARSAVVGRFR